jgi:hypothetical protein
VRYIGGDIVPELVHGLEASHASATRRFVHLDLTEDPLPAADMLVCRDCLIHLSHADVAKTFRNVAASDFRYVAFTDFPLVPLNPDILTGSVRITNLRIAPFHLPPPLREVVDEGGWVPSRKVLAVWSIDQIRAAVRPR